ncbi:hypothetical protein [Sagittula stellata]|uniref:hypothetical protein n=1 Tax=Sagittula stellata TaxID=52603 RepID=UPI0012F508AF|nr:hypothetical protein [Sagittula stellata]
MRVVIATDLSSVVPFFHPLEHTAQIGACYVSKPLMMTPVSLVMAAFRKGSLFKMPRLASGDRPEFVPRLLLAGDDAGRHARRPVLAAQEEGGE